MARRADPYTEGHTMPKVIKATQAAAIKATESAVATLVGFKATIDASNLDIGRELNRLAPLATTTRANTPDGEKVDDTDKGIASALMAIAGRAGLAKQRLIEQAGELADRSRSRRRSAERAKPPVRNSRRRTRQWS